jgi:hypothetical protein
VPRYKLSGGKKLAAFMVPWIFMAFFLFMYVTFMIPHLTDGHLAMRCLGAFVTVALLSFSIATVTFSRDVLRGRYPG